MKVTPSRFIHDLLCYPNMVAASKVWLLKFQLIKIKNSVFQSLQPHFKGLTSLWGYPIEQADREHFFLCRKFYWIALV